jgi:hypothetical protein
LAPWKRLAVTLNNRTKSNQFQPQNPCVEYYLPEPTAENPNPQPVKKEPFIPPQNGALVALEISRDLGYINPNEEDRPMRDDKWVKETYGEIKREIQKVWSRFDRSGEHRNQKNTKDGRLEWHTKFANTSDDITKYAIHVLDTMFDSIGCALPSSVGRDTGLLSGSSNGQAGSHLTNDAIQHQRNREYSSNPSAVRQRESRDRKGKESEGRGIHEVDSDSNISALTNSNDPDTESSAGIATAIRESVVAHYQYSVVPKIATSKRVY